MSLHWRCWAYLQHKSLIFFCKQYDVQKCWELEQQTWIFHFYCWRPYLVLLLFPCLLSVFMWQSDNLDVILVRYQVKTTLFESSLGPYICLIIVGTFWKTVYWVKPRLVIILAEVWVIDWIAPPLMTLIILSYSYLFLVLASSRVCKSLVQFCATLNFTLQFSTSSFCFIFWIQGNEKLDKPLQLKSRLHVV